jgi:hypothetical protein
MEKGVLEVKTKGIWSQQNSVIIFIINNASSTADAI